MRLIYKEIQSGDGTNYHQDSLSGTPHHKLNKANRQTHKGQTFSGDANDTMVREYRSS